MNKLIIVAGLMVLTGPAFAAEYYIGSESEDESLHHYRGAPRRRRWFNHWCAVRCSGGS
jgi:hypothetical protein